MKTRPYCDVLRKQGFTLVTRCKHAVIWRKTVGDRELNVLVAERLHGPKADKWMPDNCVTHYLNGVKNTVGPSFSSVPELEAAIQHELTRTDHPPLSKTAQYIREHGMPIPAGLRLD